MLGTAVGTVRRSTLSVTSATAWFVLPCLFWGNWVRQSASTSNTSQFAACATSLLTLPSKYASSPP